MTDSAPLAWRPPGELRQKLTELRDDLLSRMQRRGAVEPGVLPTVAGIAAALEALDRSAEIEAGALAEVDANGETIRLIVYRTGDMIAAPLSPVLAIRIGGELLAAAGERLADDLAELRAKASR